MADRDDLRPALAVLEFASVAAGIRAGDAMVKRAPVAAVYAGSVHPGKYLVMVGGATADVEEAVDAGVGTASGFLVDRVFLADVHPAVLGAVAGGRVPGSGEAVGIIETHSVAAVIEAADAALKSARVDLTAVRLADGLGGRAYALFTGALADVETAVEAGVARIDPGRLVTSVVIPQLHPEMAENLAGDLRFHGRLAVLGEA
jgi:microcompartment protein CcmL/EutN